MENTNNQTKQYFFDLVKKNYNNDDRITMNLLFNGNRMTKAGYSFFRHLGLDRNDEISEFSFSLRFQLDWQSNEREKLVNRLKDTKYAPTNKYYSMSEYLDPLEKDYKEKVIFPMVVEKLDKFIDDTNGYYILSNSYSGFVITLVSTNNTMFDLMEREYDKISWLELNEIPNRESWETALDKLLN